MAEPEQQTDDQIKQEIAEIRLAQAGDTQAFELLYRRYEATTYTLCFRLLGHPQRAEDALQEVFIRAWQRLTQFRFEAKFSTWLHRLTVNLVLNEAQRKSWWHQWLPIDEHCSDVEAICAHDFNGLDRLLPRLPTRARQVFVLYAIEGYRHEEIAQLLTIKSGTSKAQYHRARQLLQEMLK